MSPISPSPPREQSQLPEPGAKTKGFTGKTPDETPRLHHKAMAWRIQDRIGFRLGSWWRLNEASISRRVWWKRYPKMYPAVSRPENLRNSTAVWWCCKVSQKHPTHLHSTEGTPEIFTHHFWKVLPFQSFILLLFIPSIPLVHSSTPTTHPTGCTMGIIALKLWCGIIVNSWVTAILYG